MADSIVVVLCVNIRILLTLVLDSCYIIDNIFHDLGLHLSCAIMTSL